MLRCLIDFTMSLTNSRSWAGNIFSGSLLKSTEVLLLLLPSLESSVFLRSMYGKTYIHVDCDQMDDLCRPRDEGIRQHACIYIYVAYIITIRAKSMDIIIIMSLWRSTITPCPSCLHRNSQTYLLIWSHRHPRNRSKIATRSLSAQSSKGGGGKVYQYVWTFHACYNYAFGYLIWI